MQVCIVYDVVSKVLNSQNNTRSPRVDLSLSLSLPVVSRVVQMPDSISDKHCSAYLKPMLTFHLGCLRVDCFLADLLTVSRIAVSWSMRLQSCTLCMYMCCRLRIASPGC